MSGSGGPYDGRMVPAPYGSQNSSIPQVFGILNIVFSLLLFVSGFAMLVGEYTQCLFVNQELRLLDEAKRQELRKPIANVATESRNASSIEENASAFLRSDDFRISNRFYWCLAPALLSGFVLNLAMFTTGLGLLAGKNCARLGGICVAALEIVRHVILLLISLFWLVPAEAKTSSYSMFEQGSLGGPPGMGGQEAGQIATLMSAFTVVQSVLTALIAVIYPMLSLWFLSRERARLACVSALVDDSRLSNVDAGRTF